MPRSNSLKHCHKVGVGEVGGIEVEGGSKVERGGGEGREGGLPGLACREGSESSARAVAPHHELPRGCTCYDDISIRRLTQLGHMHSSLQVAVIKYSDSVERA